MVEYFRAGFAFLCFGWFWACVAIWAGLLRVLLFCGCGLWVVLDLWFAGLMFGFAAFRFMVFGYVD